MTIRSFTAPLVVGLASLSTVASAQNNLTLEEIVVTAQKREQTLQDIPAAVSAIPSERPGLIGCRRKHSRTGRTRAQPAN